MTTFDLAYVFNEERRVRILEAISLSSYRIRVYSCADPNAGKFEPIGKAPCTAEQIDCCQHALLMAPDIARWLAVYTAHSVRSRVA